MFGSGTFYRLEVYRKTVQGTRLREIRPLGQFINTPPARAVADRLHNAVLMGRLKNIESICVVRIMLFGGAEKRRVMYRPGRYDDVVEPVALRSAAVTLGPRWAFLDEVQ